MTSDTGFFGDKTCVLLDKYSNVLALRGFFMLDLLYILVIDQIQVCPLLLSFKELKLCLQLGYIVDYGPEKFFFWGDTICNTVCHFIKKIFNWT